jgi:isoquinoline 1-oxidoreductase alpha subunit
MQAASLLNKHPDPTDEEIVKTMNTVLCRCMTCDRIKVAIRGAARQYLRDDNHPCVHS